jgi:hypothetical protein
VPGGRGGETRADAAMLLGRAFAGAIGLAATPSHPQGGAHLRVSGCRYGRSGLGDEAAGEDDRNDRHARASTERFLDLIDERGAVL